MDSQHRHELEQNDLMDFASNFGAWWEKHGTRTLVAVLVVLAIVFGVRLYRARAVSQRESAWADLANATSPDTYATVASEYGDGVVTALANLRGADLLLNRAASGVRVDEKGQTTTQPSAEDRQRDLQEAEKMYRQVSGASGLKPIFRLNAQMGLAAIAEARANWSEASSIYGKVIEGSEPFPMLKAQAEARLAMLERMQAPSSYAPEPPATQPTTRPG